MTNPCTRCREPLPAGWQATRPCPRCLLALGLESEDGPPRGQDAAGADALGPAPTPEELAPDFPELEVLALIGEGGMGAVYRARQRELDRLVALKVLRPRIDPDGTLAERFLREARALARLSHPGIVSVYAFGRAGERLYLVMELVEGTSLRALIRQGGLSAPQCLQLVVEMCAALQAAHEHGIVHRDIKPENVLIDRAGRVKIADFGLAKVSLGANAPRLTLSGQAMGTPQYMAPEQIEHPLEVDHRADLYALGVVLYELLTGELPLGRFAPPSHKVTLDVRLDEVVLKALEKDPGRRYQAASEIGSRVEEIRHTPPPLPESEEEQMHMSNADESRGGGCSPALWIGAILLFLLLVPLTCALLFMGTAYEPVKSGEDDVPMTPALDPPAGDAQAPGDGR